jgi:hypothetical protein
MQPPNAINYNDNPEYLRGLIATTGLSQRAVAERLGVGQRIFRSYIADRDCSTAQPIPYPVQYALEMLVAISNTQS